MAQTVNLAFSGNPAGTRHYVYHRVTGGTYSAADRRDAATAATYAWVFSGAPYGTHLFVSTAYAPDGAGIVESAYSNEVSWINAPQPPTLTITSVTAQINRKDATLQAATNGPAMMKFVYVTKGKTYTVIPIMSGNTFTVNLNKLSPMTNYSYQWQGATADGSVAVLDGSFTTR